MIYIPSKGRAGTAKTITAILQEAPLFHRIVVEPQDFAAYRKAYPKASLLQLPANNKGISAARNFCLNHAIEQGHEHMWMIDDDLGGVGEVVNGKIKKSTYAKVLGAATELLGQFENLVVGGLEYQQYAWAAKKEFAFNSYCDTCVYLNVKNARHFRYRENIKEDRDMALQALSSGYITARTSFYCFANPKNGSNLGGLHEEYKAGKEKLWSERMIKLWPGVCIPHPKKKDRHDVKINWRLFKDVKPVRRSES